VNTLPQHRLDYIDNLRWVMIVLVVSMHAAVTYSHLGSWYFMEDPKPALLGTLLFAFYQMGLQAFFMGLLFLLAGYFVPGAVDRKGSARFLRDRFVRLGIPALFYMIVLHPITVFWLLRDQRKIQGTFSDAYLNYLRSGRFIGSSGPMWFTVALLMFSLAYTLARRLRPPSRSLLPEAPLPTNRQVVGLALVMGLCTFLVRIVQPMGTNILNMQLCFFSQYILLFAIGVLAWRRNWLSRIPFEFGIRWFRGGLILGSLAWLIVIGAIVVTHTEKRIDGGLSWQSAALCFWESFFCLGICLGLLVWFREKYNWQGKLEKWMTDNCFAVYLFHAPVLIAVTLGLHGFDAPKAVKFLAATLAGTVLTYLASHFIFRRIPLLQRVL
jgi:fucose 4-O-acetylase-like acetyltransferase